MKERSPRQNPELVGHEEAERTVLDALASGRLAHAWLISGPQGIGKATFAYRFARHVLRHPPDAGPDLFGGGADTLALPEDDPVFRRVAAGSHGDLRVIERGFMEDKAARRRAEIVVGDVRELATFMGLTSSEGGWRVVLIDEAETMNRNAANALLKVLEEPPPRSLLLLVCHNPARLPATVRSRCRRLSLKPLTSEVLDVLLSRALPDLGGEDRRLILGLAEGSPGRALTLQAQGGLALCQEMLGLMAGGGRLDVRRLHALGDLVARDDAAFAALADLLPWWLARAIRAHALLSGGALPGGALPGEEAVMPMFFAAAPLDRWVEVWEKVSALFERARAVHLDRKQTVLSAFHLVERTLAPP